MSESAKTMLKQLKNPFDPKFVKFRVGATNEKKENGRVIQEATKGIALAYVDSREVKKRLDDVMGFGNWQDKLERVDGGFVCTISLRIDGEWIPFSGAGEDSKMSAIKGGASDAFKRAAAKIGIGHYLYYLPNIWVPVNKFKQLVEQPQLPDWALPNDDIENWEDIAELESVANSGADEDEVDLDSVVSSAVRITKAENLEELQAAEDSLSPNQRVLLANEIGQKKRELQHVEKISPANS